MISPRLKQVFKGNPLRGSYFRVEYEPGARGQEEGEGSNRDGRENWSPGHYVVEAAEQLLSDEVDPDLFTGLPDDSGEKIRVRRLVPTARQRHMPRPGIARAVGTSYQEYRIGIGRDNDGYCRPHQCSIVSRRRKAVGQAVLKPAEPGGQCE